MRRTMRSIGLPDPSKGTGQRIKWVLDLLPGLFMISGHRRELQLPFYAT